MERKRQSGGERRRVVRRGDEEDDWRLDSECYLSFVVYTVEVCVCVLVISWIHLINLHPNLLFIQPAISTTCVRAHMSA